MAGISLGIRDNWAFFVSVACCIVVYVLREKIQADQKLLVTATVVNVGGLAACFYSLWMSSSLYKLFSAINFIILALSKVKAFDEHSDFLSQGLST